MHTKKKGTPASGLKCLKCCGISAATGGLQVPFCRKYCFLNTPTAQPAQQSTFRTLTLHGAIFPPRCAPRRLLFNCRRLLLIAEAESYSSARTHPTVTPFPKSSHRPWPYQIANPKRTRCWGRCWGTIRRIRRTRVLRILPITRIVAVEVVVSNSVNSRRSHKNETSNNYDNDVSGNDHE